MRVAWGALARVQPGSGRTRRSPIMRTVAEHLAACLEIARPAAPLDVVLLDAVGCVLAEDSSRTSICRAPIWRDWTAMP